MKITISQELFYNIVNDWKKKEVSLSEKSKFLKAYLNETGMSQRELARVMEISHSTLHDWVSMRQQNKTYTKKYNDNIFSIADRLLFLLSKKETVSTKEFMKINEIHSELGKKNILGGD